jgi:hypothetical protein
MLLEKMPNSRTDGVGAILGKGNAVWGKITRVKKLFPYLLKSLSHLRVPVY